LGPERQEKLRRRRAADSEEGTGVIALTPHKLALRLTCKVDEKDDHSRNESLYLGLEAKRLVTKEITLLVNVS
jgi:hypothetical protein